MVSVSALSCFDLRSTFRDAAQGPRARRVRSYSEHVTDESSTLNRLLRRVSRGDTSAMSSLYDALAPHIFGLVRTRLEHASALDVTQQVFLDLWRRARHFDPSRHRATEWASSIASEWIARARVGAR